MSVTPNQISSVYTTLNATEHYLSADRRDGVKVNWEEPFSRFVFKQAIDSINTSPPETLRVLDVGAGTGDGYSLLNQLFNREPRFDECKLEYLGVDISAEMVETANRLYQENSNISFEKADIRSKIPDGFFDLYLSCGVPYSHLTPAELQKSLKTIFSNILKHQSRCAVVVDVLGRYSIEWQPMWGENVWDYRMSFFNSDGAAKPTLMSFYSHEHLQKIIDDAASNVGCTVEKVMFFDRSIVVGRHTSTGDFNPEIPQYRDLVNSLLNSNQNTDLSQLTLQVPSGTANAPKHISEFFKQFSAWWNTIVAQAAELINKPIKINQVALPPALGNLEELIQEQSADISEPQSYRQIVESAVAHKLQQLEANYQPGYGVGHDLFAVVILEANQV